MALLAFFAHAQVPLLMNVPNRPANSLDGKWHYIADPQEIGYYDYRMSPYDERENPGTGAFFTRASPQSKSERIEYSFEKSPTLWVPGSWNVQDEALFLYEGALWYQRNFDYQKPEGQRVFLYFGAASLEAHVYVNGQKAGVHTGGFTPFNFEVTDLLQEGENFVVVKVDNTRRKEAVPTNIFDWWNHGGLTRSVKLISVPETFIREYKVQLAKGSSDRLSGFVQLDGPQAAGRQVRLRVPEAGIEETATTGSNGRATFSFRARKLELWDTENPKRYRVELATEADQLADMVGFRTVEVQGTDILLNGKKVFLRGICMHEENPMEGRRNYSQADAAQMFAWVQELNANFVRLAHYPHNEHMPRMADSLGILLWEEIPVYWTIDWENPATLANAKQQLQELVTRDQNRASVIIWSMANETPVGEPRNQFLKSLVETARGLDDTRLISAAMEVHHESDGSKTINDPFGQYTDIISFNQYHGWYGGDPAEFPSLKWKVEYEKPVLVSEWGGGAQYGYHADRETIWSEDYQAWLYEKTLEGLDSIPGLSGFTPWILADFRSPRRPLPVVQDMWNRKGIISEGGHKKMAFKVLQQHYLQRKQQEEVK